MSHLFSFRSGWQSEHLAKFILSKFSFVAEPSTVSDDLGSDFFCTLFEIKDKKFLLPQNSFAIQIKSKKEIDKNKNKFEITNKNSYMCNLEIPFFVGVVDRDKLTLTIYAGEYICDYFSHLPNHPNVKELYIELIEKRDEPLNMYYVRGGKAYVKFPKVVEIKAKYDYLSEPKKIEDLFNLCRLIQENIASKISNEFIFKRFESNFVHIYSGCGSARVFRENFLKRLAEVFSNLKWLYESTSFSKDLIEKEFEIYRKSYKELEELYGGFPNYLISAFERLNKLMKN